MREGASATARQGRAPAVLGPQSPQAGLPCPPMRADDHPLSPLGPPDLAPPSPEVEAACIRVAQRIVRQGRARVGLLPASGEVAVVPVGLLLAWAVIQVRQGAKVGFLDANQRWPAWPVPATAEAAEIGDGVLITRPLGPRLNLLLPRPDPALDSTDSGPRRSPRLPAQGLATLLAAASAEHTHLLVDLTGFRELGDYLAAVDLLDGVIVCARAGQTRERELVALHHALPAARRVGVLLLGGETS